MTVKAKDIWINVSDQSIPVTGERYIIPASYSTFSIDLNRMYDKLSFSPQEFSVAVSQSSNILRLPMPDGTYQNFSIVESSLFPDKLAQKYPTIKSYLGQGVDDKTATLRLSVDHNGFHAMIIAAHGTVYIDPYSINNTDYCISYYKKDFYATNTKVRDQKCVEENFVFQKTSTPFVAGQSGDELRVYRAAIATTGEYSQFHGGTTADAIAAVNTTLNRINGVYEREASFRLQLVENNDLIIYTDATTDPYTNGNAGAMINENQTNVDDVIGSSNYDIGHVFGKDSGGLAGLGVVCLNNQKARGITGHPSPIGDPFDIDYVCHEMGHQFGGNHTQNNSCERTSSSAYEPGSASTIMGYAGICAPNIQNYSDDYYHTYSFDQITTHTNGTGNCAEITPTGNNIPVANAGEGGFTIPANTPFELIGSGNDLDPGNELTYCWEQFDLGPVTDSNDDNLQNPSGNQPIFRSLLPTTSPTRVFPNMDDLLNGTETIGELLPTYSRDLTFRLTVRDNNAGGGGVSYDQMAFDVSEEAGPFVVNAITDNWEYGNTYTVTWDVANTDVAPINCSTVDIYLSTDAGLNFDELLISGVPNTGSAEIVCPNLPAADARVKVKATDNVFFNISNIFQLVEPTEPNFAIVVDPIDLDVCSGEMSVFDIQVEAILGYDQLVNLSIPGAPAELSVNFDPTDVVPGGNSTLTISSPLPIPAGVYPFDIEATSGEITHSEEVTVSVYLGIPEIPALLFPTNELTEVSLTPSFTWEEQEAASSYSIQIATDQELTNVVDEVSNINDITYTIGQLLDPETQYFWALIANSPCGDSEQSEVFSFTTGLDDAIEIPGCTDETMFNYNENATIDDGSCVPFLFGCTNSNADNFDPDANQDNGSCIISGCTNPDALNFDVEATNDDGSCMIAGCTDPEASNYNEEANVDDGSCVPNIYGCTDPEAYNYNPNANVESGNCNYTSWVIIDYLNLDGSNYQFWTYINQIQFINNINWNMGDGTQYQSIDEPIHSYTENGVYEVSVTVISLTGAYTAYATVEVNGVIYGCTDEDAVNFNADANIDDNSCEVVVEGCTDPNAINYDELANTDDGSCIGSVYGCTDETALNYNAEANIDDGSCESIIEGCTDEAALNYIADANTDDGSCEYPLSTQPDWVVQPTSNNHIILIPNTADISINDMPIELGDYIGVFYTDQDGIESCAGMMLWQGITNTMTVYGTDPNEFNGLQVGDVFTWKTWKATTNEVRDAIADYDATMPNTNAYAVDGISSITALSNTVAQSIVINEGWNLISTYIVPDYPSMGDFFAPVVNDLFLAKDEVGNVFWPDYNLNNIGDHTMAKAYKVKMNADTELEVRGALSNPMDYPIELAQGWSYLGYLRTKPANIAIVMESIENDILLIKDGVGNVYWPEFGVNTIGDMEPGKGYQIRMTNPANFTYPSNEIDIPEFRYENRRKVSYFTNPNPKEFNMTIGLPLSTLNSFNIGDEVAVFNDSNELIGSSVYYGKSLVITAWIDANDIGSNMQFSYWSSITKIEEYLHVEFSGNVNLQPNAIELANAITVNRESSSRFNVFPNPSSDYINLEFNLSEESDILITILNAIGEKVIELSPKYFEKGLHTELVHLNDLSSGLYFIKLSSNTSNEVNVFKVQK